MTKGLLFFLILWAVLAVALVVFRGFTKQERWAFFKVASVAAGLAIVALLLVLSVVFIF